MRERDSVQGLWDGTWDRLNVQLRPKTPTNQNREEKTRQDESREKSEKINAIHYKKTFFLKLTHSYAGNTKENIIVTAP